MNKSHTPGPWHATDSFIYANHDAQLPAVYNAGAAIPIAKRCNLTRDADMRLIAAAPELLAVLRRILSEADGGWHNDSPTAKIARDVLKKLEGSK